MSRNESRSFFRGAEFSRFLILAGLLLVGWPAVYYFGFAGVKPEPPRPDAIASQPPLPQPDDTPVLWAVADVTERVAADTPAQAYLLDKVRSNARSLPKEARREVLPVNLLKNPKRYRGLPIHFEGTATQVYAVDDIPIEVSPSGRLYEVWMFPLDHDQRMYPLSVIVENAPPGLPGGRNLNERVVFNGYFYRLIKYQAGDGIRFAPLLLGRLDYFPELSQDVPRTRSRFWTFLPIGLLVLYVFIRFAFNLRKIRRRIPTITSRAEGRNELDAEQLEAWLQAPEADEQDPNPS